MDQLIEKYNFIEHGLVKNLEIGDAINAIKLIQHDPVKLSELSGNPT